jgi:hypothetical protein
LFKKLRMDRNIYVNYHSKYSKTQQLFIPELPQKNFYLKERYQGDQE